MGRGVKYWGGFAALLFVVFCFSAVFYGLRAVFTQERFADVLGRCVLFYLINRMGHA